MVQNWPVSANREVGIGTRLCRIGIWSIAPKNNLQIIDVLYNKTKKNFQYMYHLTKTTMTIKVLGAIGECVKTESTVRNDRSV